MTEIDLAVEHELIVAGGWYPGMRAEIVAALGNVENPDVAQIRVAIAEQRKAHPERFLPEEEQRQVDDAKDAAARLLAAVAGIEKTRFHYLRNITAIRESEPVTTD